MKRASIDLNGMKSRCFVLLACLSLVVATTSCSNDEFETNLPEEQRQYTKAELIEQALSRMPQTRANENPNAVVMVTVQDSVAIQCSATIEMTIYEDGKVRDKIGAGIDKFIYVFPDKKPSYNITIVGPKDAISYLNVDNNGLILLSAPENTRLSRLSCRGNDLDEINLAGCLNLMELDVSNNAFSSIDVSGFPGLDSFFANHNRLTELDFSGNPNLYLVEAAHNPLRDMNLQENPDMLHLDVSFTQLQNLDLRQCAYLTAFYLEEVPIKRINNQPICDTSFSMFKELWQLNLAYTPFSALDLSKTMVFTLDISGTEITRLDISGLKMEHLRATRSKLSDLIYDNLDYLFELRIERTPFERDSMNMTRLVQYLPPRSSEVPGHLYTYYSGINGMAQDFARIHWLINQ